MPLPTPQLLSSAIVRAVAAGFGLATRLRGGRVLHPRGVTYRASVSVAGGQAWGAELLDRPGVHEGVVRVSRALGLPRTLPDAEGLALRLPGHGVDGAPLDLLVNSAWRFVFVPAVLSRTWSSILPYRTGDGALVLLGARRRPGGFLLLVAAPLGRWRPWAQLVLHEQVPGEDLGFAPTIGADDLVPVQLFRTLRAASYICAQAARGADRPVTPASAAPAPGVVPAACAAPPPTCRRRRLSSRA